MQPTRSELSALGFALAPFVVSVGDSYSRTENGVVVAAYDYNYAGVVLGVVAIALAVRAFARLPREAPAGDSRPLHLLAIGAIVGLALYQIARGASLLT
jgi:surface polysaccharide O-acyltransferase-like enzyme